MVKKGICCHNLDVFGNEVTFNDVAYSYPRGYSWMRYIAVSPWQRPPAAASPLPPAISLPEPGTATSATLRQIRDMFTSGKRIVQSTSLSALLKLYNWTLHELNLMFRKICRQISNCPFIVDNYYIISSTSNMQAFHCFPTATALVVSDSLSYTVPRGPLSVRSQR